MFTIGTDADTDRMRIYAGAEKVIIHRETLLRTTHRNFTWFTSEFLRPQRHTNSRQIIEYKVTWNDVSNRKTSYHKVRISTEAQTPFLSSGPKFHLTFDHRTRAPQSWVDVMISRKSEENSDNNGHFLDFHHLHNYILFTRTGSYKLKSEATRMHSLLVDLGAVDENKTVRLAINVDTMSYVSRIKMASTVFLNWTSVMELSRDISRKSIALPGTIRFVIFKPLNFLQDFSVDIHWITDMFTGSSFQSNDVTSCRKESLPIKHEFCVNYTSTQKNYIFFWNIYRHWRCYRPGKKCIYPSLPERKVANSWTEASQLCKSIGGSLPIIRNRDELNGLRTFLKLSEDMPPVEALYIGIRRSFEDQVLTPFPNCTRILPQS